jgi:hypothetical protein
METGDLASIARFDAPRMAAIHPHRIGHRRSRAIDRGIASIRLPPAAEPLIDMCCDVCAVAACVGCRWFSYG